MTGLRDRPCIWREEAGRGGATTGAGGGDELGTSVHLNTEVCCGQAHITTQRLLGAEETSACEMGCWGKQ